MDNKFDDWLLLEGKSFMTIPNVEKARKQGRTPIETFIGGKPPKARNDAIRGN